MSASQADLLVRHPKGFEVFAELVGDGTPEAIRGGVEHATGNDATLADASTAGGCMASRERRTEEAWWRSGAAIPMSLFDDCQGGVLMRAVACPALQGGRPSRQRRAMTSRTPAGLPWSGPGSAEGGQGAGKYRVAVDAGQGRSEGSKVSLSVIYVRVSTEEQVDFSPDAQARRCKDYGRQHDLGPFVVIVDPGFTGSTLERPGMQEMLELVEAGRVAHVIVWRLDRLSRDTGDQSYLVRLFGRQGVRLHSVNDGVIDLDTASGRLHVGFHGVLAQYYREQLVENVQMGMEQAARRGRWLNRAPTGYDMVNGELVPNEVAPLVGRIFALRACGASYPDIESGGRDLLLDRAADRPQPCLPGRGATSGSVVPR